VRLQQRGRSKIVSQKSVVGGILVHDMGGRMREEEWRFEVQTLAVGDACPALKHMQAGGRKRRNVSVALRTTHAKKLRTEPARAPGRTTQPENEALRCIIMRDPAAAARA
jgi:hypothetical protein